MINTKDKFIYNEIIVDDESSTLEYKRYNYPFSELNTQILKQTINAFINFKGGHIYIGISDYKEVKGILLNDKDKDNCGMHITGLIRKFYPDGLYDNIRVEFKDVKRNKCKIRYCDNDNINKNELIYSSFLEKKLYIVKIIINRGNKNKLYSLDNNYFQSYIRLGASNIRLKTREIYEEIVKRSKYNENSNEYKRNSINSNSTKCNKNSIKNLSSLNIINTESIINYRCISNQNLSQNNLNSNWSNIFEENLDNNFNKSNILELSINTSKQNSNNWNKSEIFSSSNNSNELVHNDNLNDRHSKHKNNISFNSNKNKNYTTYNKNSSKNANKKIKLLVKDSCIINQTNNNNNLMYVDLCLNEDYTSSNKNKTNSNVLLKQKTKIATNKLLLKNNEIIEFININ